MQRSILNVNSHQERNDEVQGNVNVRIMVDFRAVYTTGYHLFSGRAAWRAQTNVKWMI